MDFAKSIRAMVLIAILAIILVACGTNSSKQTLGLQQTNPTTKSTKSVVIPVKMQPQSPQPLIRELSANRIFNGFDFTAFNNKSVSATTPPFPEMIKTASAYVNDNQFLNRISKNGQTVKFTPYWENGSISNSIKQASYLMYKFYLPDYYNSGDTQSFEFDWLTKPSKASDFWVGLSNTNRKAWSWFNASQGFADNVLTLNSLKDYTNDKGYVFMLIVMLGKTQPELSLIKVGEHEFRALGAAPSGEKPADYPPKYGTEFLPESFDLSNGCAQISDQGQTNSSSAFAVNNGAYNYELNSIYKSLGWDLTNAKFQVSPKYFYMETGKVQKLGCPDQGRLMNADLFDCLKNTGTSSEANAAYDLLTGDSNNCTSDWSTEALADANVLKIDNWEALECRSDSDLESIKITLVNENRPIVMTTQVDWAFCNYTSGQVWDYTGPSIGGQAMLIVGFDEAKSAFKVRNSWSESWGDKGYCWINFKTFKNEGADVYCWTIYDNYSSEVQQRFLGSSTTFLPPSDLNASDGSSFNRIDLTWTKSPHATGYKIYRDKQDELIATVGDISSWSDISIKDTFTHIYWVRATYLINESILSSPDAGYCKAAAGMLVPPTNITASKDRSDGIILTWTKSKDATEYEIYRDTQNNFINTVGDIEQYLDSSVNDLHSHKYWLKAKNISDVSDFSDPIEGSRILLTPPIELNATLGKYPDKVNLSWVHATGIQPDGYRMYRSDTSETTGFALLADNLGYVTEYSDTTAKSNVKYWYKAVSYKDKYEDSEFSNVAQGYLYIEITPNVPSVVWPNSLTLDPTSTATPTFPTMNLNPFKLIIYIADPVIRLDGRKATGKYNMDWANLGLSNLFIKGGIDKDTGKTFDGEEFLLGSNFPIIMVKKPGEAEFVAKDIVVERWQNRIALHIPKGDPSGTPEEQFWGVSGVYKIQLRKSVFDTDPNTILASTEFTRTISIEMITYNRYPKIYSLGIYDQDKHFKVLDNKTVFTKFYVDRSEFQDSINRYIVILGENFTPYVENGADREGNDFTPMMMIHVFLASVDSGVDAVLLDNIFVERIEGGVRDATDMNQLTIPAIIKARIPHDPSFQSGTFKVIVTYGADPTPTNPYRQVFDSQKITIK